MRNFFKTAPGKSTSAATKRQLAEILDTDEDKVINRYKGHLKYINKVKKELLQRTADLMRYSRQLHTR